MKILVSRTDRAGDFILTLPVFRELRLRFPQAKIYAHLRRYTAPLAKLCPEIDNLIIDDDYPPGIISKPLIQKFKRENFTHAVVVHPTPRAILSLYLAGVPYRAGRASNIFMGFLNPRHVQKRSKNQRHEFEYNLELLSGLVDERSNEPYSAVGHFSVENSAEKIPNGVIIHPGSGGSAYNIPTFKYVELAKILVQKGAKVAVSLGPGEESLKTEFEKALAQEVEFLMNVPDLYELARRFSPYKVFVGGSTGPLHLAALIGLYSVAFFPPVKAMVPERWGPRGGKSFVVQPKLPLCNGRCNGCQHNPCMENLTLENAIEAVLKQLS
jgi:ADP-heptose:LPS heptosyltransferase